MYIFFDTETTGLPKDWRAPMTKLSNWPRVIQLAWMVCDDTGCILTAEKRLIKPDGWEIPTEKFWLDNGFHQKQSLKDGIPISQVLGIFINDLNHCSVLVAHNMSFDYNVLGAEMIRANKKGNVLKKICTKDEGTEYCKLPGNYGRYKWPNLTELHQKLFNKPFEGAHDALSDVIACKDCFFEMIKLNIIKI